MWLVLVAQHRDQPPLPVPLLSREKQLDKAGREPSGMVNGRKMKAYLLFANLPGSSLNPCRDIVVTMAVDVSERYGFGWYMAFEAGFMVPVDCVIYI